jgi:hypothetical protein
MTDEPPSPTGEPINAYLGRSIFAVLIFWPLGIVALVYSIMARASQRHGDSTRAAECACLAAAWGMAALGMFLILLLGAFLADVLFRGWL